MLRKLIFIVFSLLLFSGTIAADLGNNSPKMILFYGDTCPHCKILEKFIAENKIAKKTPIIKKEVFNNSSNLQLLAKKANSCGIYSKTLSVPFLWVDNNCGASKEQKVCKIYKTCLMGVEKIENFFRKL